MPTSPENQHALQMRLTTYAKGTASLKHSHCHLQTYYAVSKLLLAFNTMHVISKPEQPITNMPTY